MILLLLACGGPRDGSAVGNPGNAGFVGVDVPGGVDLEVGTLEVKAFGVEQPRFRRGEDLSYGVHEDFDLLDDTPWLYMPAGRWSGVAAFTGDPSILLEGTTDEVEFCLELPLGRVDVDEFFEVDGQDFWISFDLSRVLQPALLEAQADEEGVVYVGPDDLGAELLANILREDVELDVQ